MHLRDLVEIGFMIRVRCLFLRNPRSLHFLAQVRETAQKERVVVTVSVSSLSYPAESPPVRLADKGREFRVLEIGGNHADFKLSRLQHAPRSSVRHPSNDIGKILSCQHGVQLRWKIGDSSGGNERRQWIRIFLAGEVVVEVERIRFGLFFRQIRQH